MNQTYEESDKSWICPNCTNELGELNGWCEYCRVNDNIYVYNPDKYYIRDIRISHIEEDIMETEKKGLSGAELLASIEANERLTPQEKLHAKLFYHEKVLVKDMDILTLRAHREELAQIAFEARARLGAVDDEENERKKRGKKEGPSGFERSPNTDDTSTNAINTIKERQKKLSKTDKIREGLIKLGMSPDDADKIMSAKNILDQTKTRAQNNTPPEIKPTEPSQPVFNPFEKKENK